MLCLVILLDQMGSIKRWEMAYSLGNGIFLSSEGVKWCPNIYSFVPVSPLDSEVVLRR